MKVREYINKHTKENEVVHVDGKLFPLHWEYTKHKEMMKILNRKVEIVHIDVEDGKRKFNIVTTKKHVNPTYYDLNEMYEDIINRPQHYNLGQIETREYILDVLHHNKHLEPFDAYYLGNILKYLSVRLGNKDDKLQDMKKAKNYLDKWIKEYDDE